MKARTKNRRLLTVIVILLLLCLGIQTWIGNTHIRLTTCTVQSPKLPESFSGFRFLVVSDYHETPYYERVISLLRKVRPDAVLLCGDMVNIEDEPGSFSRSLALLDAAEGIPVYAVTGNHESQNPDWLTVQEVFLEHGVVWLHDESVLLRKNEDAIQLIGLRDLWQNDLTDADLAGKGERLAALNDPGLFTAVLNHRAGDFPFLEGSGADLILSGHMHGGVWRLPFVGGVFGHDDDPYFPEFCRGRYDGDDGCSMIVSAGCDFNRKKLRLNNPPEILLVTLRTAG